MISDATETGRSCIYTLPVGGGDAAPRDTATPSYWHGWSPDGATLAYCAERDGAFDIYTIPANGGDETRLTDGRGHSDGPDYTPDGRFIWFNSSRAGHMQLWRMRPDGSDLERMTDDDRGRTGSRTPRPTAPACSSCPTPPASTGHPPDKDVELRLMPAGGGAPRPLFALFGGQGSINVPCWAPDGRRFAFVRYAPP